MNPLPSADFPAPLQCLFQPKRYKVLYGGRGAGRSWGVARALLLLGTKQPIRVLCARELQNSISESVHKVLSDQILALGLDTFYDVQVARILGINGTSFAFEGIKNNVNKVKSYEGIDYCWVEEANKVSRNSWTILIPTIRKEESEIWMTFNPELETDYTYVRFVKEADDSQMSVVKMTWRDNPWFPEVLRLEMEADRKRDYDHYLNIWEGNCVQVLEGAVFMRELRRAQEEGRIGEVPYDREFPVQTFWDLGRANSTAIWFAQQVAMQYRVIDFYQANESLIPMDDETGGIDHFLKVCQNKGYVYGDFWLPHDAKPKRLGMKRSIYEMIRGHGFNAKIVPNMSKIDGINAARIVFPNCWFDEKKCEEGLQALRNYRYRVVDGQFSNEPLHDWASDAADAFRYLALGLRSPPEPTRVLEKLQAAAANVLARKNSDFESRRSLGSRLGWMR